MKMLDPKRKTHIVIPSWGKTKQALLQDTVCDSTVGHRGM